MSGRGRMSDRRLGIAQVCGNRNHAGGVYDIPGRSTTALDLEGHDGPSRTLLPGRELMLGVGGKAGVVHLSDARMRFEPARELKRVARLRLHPDPQGLESLQEDPRIERRE